MNLSFTPIGHVKNAIREPREGFSKKNETSILDLLPQFAEGLYRLDDSSYIDVLFYFDRSDSYQLQGPIFTGEVKGVFASRSPRRPNGIGVTTVRLQKVERNKVWVSGLDAMDGTPILDIKPGSMPPTTETAEAETLRRERLRNNPRFDIIRAIKSEDLEELLLGAAQMHGHFCPGLALGVKATAYAMNALSGMSDNMEDLRAILETKTCFTDGLQYVSGCTLGNQALRFKDLEQTAFTLTRKNGKGLRVAAREEARQLIQESFPEFNALFQQVVIQQSQSPQLKEDFRKATRDRAFAVLQLPFDQLFTMKEVAG